jgi:UDP-N-acetylmuramoyl-tripeptide--D-alanyl-D-alanine ligase
MIDFTNWISSGAGYWLRGKLPTIVERICNDTRKLEKNFCFIAIKTERVDGHDFLAQAEQRGASCAIVDHEIGGVTVPQFICKDTLLGLNKIASFVRKNFHGKVIGITGSMGKTSTKDILALLLNVQNNKTFLTENGQLGIPFTLAKFTNDESVGIVEIGIDEVGTIENLLEIVHPTDCIITGISRIHLGNFGDENTIASEKIKLAEYALNNSCKCILAKELLQFECFRKIAEFCLIPRDEPGAKIYFNIEYSPNGRRLNLQIGNQKHRFSIPHLMSDGTAKNLVLATTYALFNGETASNIAERLHRWQPSPLRGAISQINGRTFFADCYNANSVAFSDSLQNFDRLFPNGNRLFIIGSFADRELGKYSIEENVKLGQNIPLRSGDVVVIIGERAKEVKAGLLRASPNAKNIHCLDKSKRAREFVQSHRGVIYLKGHGIYHLDKLID